MDFTLSDAQRAWQETARTQAHAWPREELGTAVAESAHAAGLFSNDLDALTAVAIVEAAGAEHPVGATPETFALLALMHLHRARLAGRVDASGGLLLLEEQDRTRWNRDDMEAGAAWLELRRAEDSLQSACRTSNVSVV